MLEGIEKKKKHTPERLFGGCQISSHMLHSGPPWVGEENRTKILGSAPKYMKKRRETRNVSWGGVMGVWGGGGRKKNAEETGGGSAGNGKLRVGVR